MNTRKLTGYLFLVYFLFIAHHSHALELNGVASFRELGNEVYLGALYLDSRSSDISAIFADNREKKMELRFSQGMSKRRWAGNWMQSIAINNNRDSLVGAAEELSEILSSFADNLTTGDTVVFHYVPGSGTAISINGTTLVKGKSASIFNLFLSTWIGAVPPSSQFKNALLGSEGSPAEQSRFAAIQPTNERIAAVKTWVTDEDELAEQKAAEEAAKAEEEAKIAASEPPTPPPAEKPEVKPEPVAVEAPAPEAPKPEPAAPAPAVASAPTPAPSPAPAPVTEVADDNETEIDLSVESILAQQAYASDLIRKIYQKVKYPATAAKRKQQGSVRINIIVARDGSVGSMNITEESEYNSLNKEALRAIASASPFSPLPAAISDENMEIVVPITFKLSE